VFQTQVFQKAQVLLLQWEQQCLQTVGSFCKLLLGGGPSPLQAHQLGKQVVHSSSSSSISRMGKGV
jgi:hypothetical protein